jgi:hypothetical protein
MQCQLQGGTKSGTARRHAQSQHMKIADFGPFSGVALFSQPTFTKPLLYR